MNPIDMLWSLLTNSLGSIFSEDKSSRMRWWILNSIFALIFILIGDYGLAIFLIGALVLEFLLHIIFPDAANSWWSTAFNIVITVVVIGLIIFVLFDVAYQAKSLVSY